MNKAFWAYSPPILFPWVLLDSPVPLSPPLIIPFSFYIWVRRVLPTHSQVWGYPMEYGQPTRGYTLKETWLSLPKKPPALHSSSVWGGSSCTLTPPCWSADWVALFQNLLRQPQLVWVHECRGPVVSRRHCFPGPLAFAIFPPPLSNSTLSYRWRLCNWKDTHLGLHTCWWVCGLLLPFELLRLMLQ